MWKVLLAATALGATAVLLVVPFHPEAALLVVVHDLTPDTPSARGIDWFVVESGGNFAVFVLVGAAALVLTGRRARAIVVGCLLSASAELVQVFVPHRVPSLADVVTNCLGAVGGVLLTSLVTASARRRQRARRAAHPA